jgi:phage terminase large subunit-like protein
VAVESPRGWRIAKEKASKKIDSIVALAMACVAAVERKEKRPIRSLHPFDATGASNLRRGTALGHVATAAGTS